MDPKATLLALDQAITDGDLDRVFDLISAYTHWRLRGGFEPVMPFLRGVSSGDEVLNRCLAAAADKDAGHWDRGRP